MVEQQNDVAAVTQRSEGLIVPLRFEMEEAQPSTQRKEKWGSSFEFYLAAISSGLIFGMWRFHYDMYQNGGSVFLLIYILLTLVMSVPMFYLETCLGQFWGKGPFHIYKFCPLLRGVGLAQVILLGVTLIYSNIFLVLFVYYTFASIVSSTLPWVGCHHSWNTFICGDRIAIGNVSSFENVLSPSEEYYKYEVLQLSEGINNLGSLRWELIGCMAAVSILLFAALFFGVRVFGKIFYATVPLSLILLGVLFIRGVTLQGASDGLILLFFPDVTHMQLPRFWVSSFTVAMWSSLIIYGIIQTLASYNEFNKPCLRLSYAVCISVIVLNVIAAMVMMSFLGALASMKGVSFPGVADSGPRLLFVTVIELLSSLPAAKFWLFAFFFMFVLLGMTEKIVMMEVIIRTVMDCLPRQTWKIRMIVVGLTCAVIFILTFPFLTQGGMYVMTLVDGYSWLAMPLLIIFELVTVTWIYGLNQFSADIKMMTGIRPPVIFKFFWAIIIPILFVCLFVYNLQNQYDLWYDGYTFPGYTKSLGYFICVMPMLAIPVYALVWLIRSRRQAPLDPDLDTKPDTDNWIEYDAKQRRMPRTVASNLRAIFRT